MSIQLVLSKLVSMFACWTWRYEQGVSVSYITIHYCTKYTCMGISIRQMVEQHICVYTCSVVIYYGICSAF